jgi:hypothetical protein
MIDADPDLPALEIFAESAWLEQYLQTLDERLSSIQQQTKLRLEAEIRHKYSHINPNPVPPFEANISDVITHVIPRFFLGGALVSVWAFYEASIEELAAYVRRKEQINLALRDLKGDFNEQARRYFADVLRVPLPFDSRDAERLSHINLLRTCFAHDNGSLRNAPQRRLADIRALAARSIGVVVEENRLIVTTGFVLDSYKVVEKCIQAVLTPLMDRYVVHRNP